MSGDTNMTGDVLERTVTKRAKKGSIPSEMEPALMTVGEESSNFMEVFSAGRFTDRTGAVDFRLGLAFRLEDRLGPECPEACGESVGEVERNTTFIDIL